MAVLRMIRYGVLGIPLAFAGLPLYVHVPKFYAETHHADLTQLGIVFLALRLLDTVLDPIIGALSDRFRAHRQMIMTLSLPLLAGGYFLLFSPPRMDETQTILWLCACLVCVYLAFSILMINYYAMSVDLSEGYNENTQLSAWREGSMLVGVLLASLLPAYLTTHYDVGEAYRLFGLALCPLLLLCAWATLSIVPPLLENASEGIKANFAVLLQNRQVRWALIVALFNAIPTAITSTLFLFFTGDVLQAGEQSGLMLAVYFLSAAIAMPLWAFISAKRSKRTGLLIAMTMAILCFIWAWKLGAGDIVPFYIVCALSGMTLGADAALLPSLFADVLADKRGAGATAFGMWNFTSKLTMALAAGIALPALARGGYVPGAHNTPGALSTLSFCYALLPCMCKSLALGLLHISPLDRTLRKGNL